MHNDILRAKPWLRLSVLCVIGGVGSSAALSQGAAPKIEATPTALVEVIKDRPSVLLGEVHDNPEQHRLRAAALRQRIEQGSRPALAFEQFDRDAQTRIDASRSEHPRDTDALIRAAGGAGWDWKLYRPYVELALEYDLPIVAANLSRSEAFAVATNGWSAVFDDRTQTALALDRLPPAFTAAHEQAIAGGHCGLLPTSALPGMVRAQIARDIVLAQAIEPYLTSGVVLLTGNGHARKDIGVATWLSPAERQRLTSIGVLETNSDEADVGADRYDVVVLTPPAERPDPCEPLRRRAPPTEPR